jgi:hypothetical protein
MLSTYKARYTTTINPCPLCNKPYDTANRQPMIILKKNCCKTLCKTCIESKIPYENQQFTCILCNPSHIFTNDDIGLNDEIHKNIVSNLAGP